MSKPKPTPEELAAELSWFERLLIEKRPKHPTAKPMKSSYKVPLDHPMMQGFVIPPDLSKIDDLYLVEECKDRGLIDHSHRVDWIQCPKCGKVIQSRQRRYACSRDHQPPHAPNERYGWGKRLTKNQKVRAKKRMEAATEFVQLRKERLAWMKEKQELEAARQRLEDERTNLERTRRLARGKRVYSVLKRTTE